MYGLQLDKNGAYLLRWSRKDHDILANTRAYLLRERSLDESLQLKDIPLAYLQSKYDSALAALSDSQTGEAARSTFTNEYQSRLNHLRKKLQYILALLKYKHASNPFAIEKHGFNVRHAARRGYAVPLPRTNGGLIRLLASYLAQESSLPPAERIPDPSFEEMQTLQTDILRFQQTRAQARIQRTSNVYERRAIITELQDLLQCAAHILIVMRFNGKVSPELALWGFTVVARTVGKGEQVNEDSTGEA